MTLSFTQTHIYTCAHTHTVIWLTAHLSVVEPELHSLHKHKGDPEGRITAALLAHMTHNAEAAETRELQGQTDRQTEVWGDTRGRKTSVKSLPPPWPFHIWYCMKQCKQPVGISHEHVIDDFYHPLLAGRGNCNNSPGQLPGSDVTQKLVHRRSEH